MDTAHPLESLLLNKQAIWAARIAKVHELSLEATQDGISKIAKTYIISEEGSGKEVHQHLLLVGNDLTRDIIKAKIKEIYPNAHGNKNFYIQEAKKKTQLLKYTIKEGLFVYKGFTNEFIVDLQRCSLPKTNLKKAFVRLEEQLALGQIEFREYVKGYIELKVQHDQPLYTGHLMALFRKLAVRHTGYTAGRYADFFVENILGID